MGIPEKYDNIENGIEYHGQINMLKAGLLLSDLSYAVSERYAHEITTPLFGEGLHGVLKRLEIEGRLTGIVKLICESATSGAGIRGRAALLNLS